MLLIYAFDIIKLFLPNIPSILRGEISNWYVGFLPAIILYSGRLFSGAGMPTEFLIIRAIDRPILYRSTVALFYLAILVVPVGIFIFSLKNPDIRVDFSAGYSSPEQCLSHVAGSTLVPSKRASDLTQIFIPDGKRLFGEWHLWSFLVAMLGVQILLLVQFKPLGWPKACLFFGKSSFKSFGDSFFSFLFSPSSSFL
jgi:hypothetical protein